MELFHSPAVYIESYLSHPENTLQWKDFPTQGIVYIIVREKKGESFINYNKKHLVRSSLLHTLLKCEFIIFIVQKGMGM